VQGQSTAEMRNDTYTCCAVTCFLLRFMRQAVGLQAL
jgi:hypothetical protein